MTHESAVCLAPGWGSIGKLRGVWDDEETWRPWDSSPSRGRRKKRGEKRTKVRYTPREREREKKSGKTPARIAGARGEMGRKREKDEDE